MQHSLRENILDAGLKVMFRSGYFGSSVRDICAAARAPHGSFTNHFRSKERFAQEVLDRYVEDENLKTKKILIVHQFGDPAVHDGVPFMVQDKKTVRDFDNVIVETNG